MAGPEYSSLTKGADRERREALERYVLPEIEGLFRVALALTRNRADAEDLVQDTVLRACRSIDRFDGRHPRAWLLTILRNAHINRNRRRRPEPISDPERAMRRPGLSVAGLPEQEVVEATFEGLVASAFLSLPEKYRRVVELVDIEGLRYLEAASLLGVPVGTVMSRLHRARARIRDRLSSEQIVPGRGT
ncbi:MAG: RNA polymerase sigma factor [Actinomycetota bacterium]